MNTYYFNNSEYVFTNKIVVITEATFRKIQDNLLCLTPSGSWNDHWLSFEANNLAEAKAHITATWCKR